MVETYLKTPQSSGLKVEGIFKNDLKLSLPDFDEEINREGSSPTRLYGMGFILLGKKKRVDTDGFSANTYRFHFSICSPHVDSSSYPLPNEKIYFLNATHALTVLPNLNLPEKKI